VCGVVNPRAQQHRLKTVECDDCGAGSFAYVVVQRRPPDVEVCECTVFTPKPPGGYEGWGAGRPCRAGSRTG
jgi:hypothetical protein